MSRITTLAVLIFGFNAYLQNQSNIPTKDDFIGIWEWQNNNEIFRVDLFEVDIEGETRIDGHFTMVQVDSNGDETVLYTSNRLIEGTNDYWKPMITGCRFVDYNESYRFSLRDNTSDYLLSGKLFLKFLNNLNSWTRLKKRNNGTIRESNCN